MAISPILFTDPSPNRPNSSRNIRLISLSECVWRCEPVKRDSDMIGIELRNVSRDSKSSGEGGNIAV
jgi:hypothetical protein